MSIKNILFRYSWLAHRRMKGERKKNDKKELLIALYVNVILSFTKLLYKKKQRMKYSYSILRYVSFDVYITAEIEIKEIDFDMFWSIRLWIVQFSENFIQWKWETTFDCRRKAETKKKQNGKLKWKLLCAWRVHTLPSDRSEKKKLILATISAVRRSV